MLSKLLTDDEQTKLSTLFLAERPIMSPQLIKKIVQQLKSQNIIKTYLQTLNTQNL